MKPLFPNLELIENKATELALLDDSLPSPPEFDLITFPQTWGSTCTGFDLASDGLPTIGGSCILLGKMVQLGAWLPTKMGGTTVLVIGNIFENPELMDVSNDK